MSIPHIKKNDGATLDVENGKIIVRKAFKIGNEYYDIEVLSGDKYFLANETVVLSKELRQSIQTIFLNCFNAAQQSASQGGRDPISPERASFLYNSAAEAEQVWSYESGKYHDIGGISQSSQGPIVAQMGRLYDAELCISSTHSGTISKPKTVATSKPAPKSSAKTSKPASGATGAPGAAGPLGSTSPNPKPKKLPEVPPYHPSAANQNLKKGKWNQLVNYVGTKLGTPIDAPSKL